MRCPLILCFLAQCEWWDGHRHSGKAQTVMDCYIKPVFTAVTKSSPNAFLAMYSEFLKSKSCHACKIFLSAKVKFGGLILEFMLATNSTGKTFAEWLGQCSNTFAALEKERPMFEHICSIGEGKAGQSFAFLDQDHDLRKGQV